MLSSHHLGFPTLNEEKMAAPLHRHQSSLEGILNFSSHPPPLQTELRNHASRRFHDICQHFDTGLSVDSYSRPRLRSIFQLMGANPLISKMCAPSSLSLPSIFLTISSCLLPQRRPRSLPQPCILQSRKHKVMAGNSMLGLGLDCQFFGGTVLPATVTVA
ncbi:hypothetical protein GGR57DRAFT_258677 [Xylariaceae sp. FL1272]|nr:hypothetical protein GGR57DRAFT_258677 [Xylariaceae sp. FL1272]